MVRLQGMRLLTRLALLVCIVSLASLLFLSRCGLTNLESVDSNEETQALAIGE